MFEKAGYIITVLKGEEYSIAVEFPTRIESQLMTINYFDVDGDKKLDIPPPAKFQERFTVYNIYRVQMVTLKEIAPTIVIPHELVMNFTTTEN